MPNMKNLVENYRNDLEKALEELNEQYGVIAKVGCIYHSGTDFHFKTEVKLGGSVEEVERNEWNKHCELFGLLPEDYGKKIIQGRSEYKLVALKPRSRKFGVVALELNSGNKYKLTTSLVKMKLGRSAHS